jgi:Ca-activated chloride channel homolog
MKRIRYSKYVPDPAGEMSMEDLLSALSDYLLQSGFQSDMWYDDAARASKPSTICAAPSSRPDGGRLAFDDDMRQNAAANGKWKAQLDELIEKLIQRMQQEDYISQSISRLILHATIRRRRAGRRSAAAGEV